MKILKTLSKRKSLIVALVVLALIMGLVIFFVLREPSQDGSASLTENTATIHKPQEVRIGLPVRLKIPKIHVDAAIERVGLTSQRDMGIPKSPANAAWYKFGPRPGEKGSSVIDGHFGYRNNIPAIFDNLHKLQKGDNLYVEDEKGTIIAFAVREFRTYGPNEDASSVFRSSDGKAHLNLITCQGIWNETQKSFSTRFVVFADKE